ESALDGARAAHLPTVGLSLDSGRVSQWRDPLAAAQPGRTETTLGVALNVPLFAGGSTEALRRQAAHQRDAARETLEQRRRQVARETLEQYDAVLAAIAQIEATQSAVDAAARALAATQTGQALGIRSMTDLLLAIQNQAAAQNAHSQARHQYVLARLGLQRAAGVVDDTQLAAINALLEP
ncbi:TolC family protein, partial [Paucibacter sp. XJ19-41]|uniref:TolC family protein n=1 Tax=Paucibacter sp. XJ19-41 TaxID=2927824 RepID=UPI00234B4020